MNKVILIGNLGNEPEIRNTQSGDEIAFFSLATSESWKDKETGEKREKTEWHKVVAFNKGAVNFAKNHLNKGSKVYIEGQLQTKKWEDENGNDRYTTEVVIKAYNGQILSLASKNDICD